MEFTHLIMNCTSGPRRLLFEQNTLEKVTNATETTP